MTKTKSLVSRQSSSPSIRQVGGLLLLLVTVACGLMGRSSAGEPPVPKKVATVEGITEYQFDNGLRLLLFPDNSQSKVSVNMTVLVGSRQEGYGETGMAHLLEHMVFKGTPTHPNIPKALNQHGAQFNGSTSSDRVNYFETLAATDENLEFAIFGGGSLASRLATRVRQQEGLSYSVGSSLSVSSQDQRAGLNISAIVNPQNIAKLEKCVQDELARLLQNGVTADELDKAREGYLQSRKVGRSSDSALAATLSGLRHLDRTMAWDADFEKKIAALTPDQVNAALRKHIDPKKLVVVAAGDFEAKPADVNGE